MQVFPDSFQTYGRIEICYIRLHKIMNVIIVDHLQDVALASQPKSEPIETVAGFRRLIFVCGLRATLIRVSNTNPRLRIDFELISNEPSYCPVGKRVASCKKTKWAR